MRTRYTRDECMKAFKILNSDPTQSISSNLTEIPSISLCPVNVHQLVELKLTTQSLFVDNL